MCMYVCGSDNEIGDEGGSAMGAALAANSTLTELNLRGEDDVVCVMMMLLLVCGGCEGCEGRVGGGGGGLICECVEMREFDALVLSVCVCIVCGSDNEIGAEGGSAMGAGLATNSTLMTLNLSSECGMLCVMMLLCVECAKGGEEEEGLEL